MTKPLSVEDASGLAVISGLQSQVKALLLCERFQSLGIKADVSTVENGFEISIFTLSAQDVLTLLGEFGIDSAMEMGDHEPHNKSGLDQWKLPPQQNSWVNCGSGRAPRA